MMNSTGEPVSSRAVVVLVAASVGAVWWLWRLWRPARDRNVAQTWYASAPPVAALWLAAALTNPPMPQWLAKLTYWGLPAVVGVLLAAGAVQGHRYRLAGKRQRAAMGLTPRRRMLTQRQLAVAWIVFGVLAWFASMVVLAGIGGALGWFPHGRAHPILVVAMLIEMAVLGEAGWLHVTSRPRKIAREDERLSRLDRGIDDCDDENGPTPRSAG